MVDDIADFGCLAQLPPLSAGKEGKDKLTRAYDGRGNPDATVNLYVRFKVLGTPILRLAECRLESFKEQVGIADDLLKHIEELESSLSLSEEFAARVSRMEVLNIKCGVAGPYIESLQRQDTEAYNKLCSVRDGLAIDVTIQGCRIFSNTLLTAAEGAALPDQPTRMESMKIFSDFHTIF